MLGQSVPFGVDISVPVQRMKIILRICMGKQHKHQLWTTQNKILLKNAVENFFYGTILVPCTPMGSEVISPLTGQDYSGIITLAKK